MNNPQPSDPIDEILNQLVRENGEELMSDRLKHPSIKKAHAAIERMIASARLDEAKSVVRSASGFEFRIETPDSLKFYSQEERIAELASLTQNSENGDK